MVPCQLYTCVEKLYQGKIMAELVNEQDTQIEAEQRLLNIALRMFKEGMDIKLVEKTTGIPQEQLIKLKNSF